MTYTANGYDKFYCWQGSMSAILLDTCKSTQEQATEYGFASCTTSQYILKKLLAIKMHDHPVAPA